jgi:uncharacterized membrane protein YeaQ/YmgE (transglycosylase-associated protein family)
MLSASGVIFLSFQMFQPNNCRSHIRGPAVSETNFWNASSCSIYWRILDMDNLLLLGAVDIMGLVIACVIGAVCGFLAGQLLKGRGLGLVGNIVVGIVGGLLFSYLFSTFDMGLGGLVNQIVGGTIGAVVLLIGISFIKKNT